MGICRKIVISILCILLLSVGGSANIFADDTVTITGTVNDDGQLVDDAGQIYEFADTDLGWQVMDQVGEKVEVEGKIEEEESDVKVIVVKSFKLLS
jgi:type 1 fimbria pilin